MRRTSAAAPARGGAVAPRAAHGTSVAWPDAPSHDRASQALVRSLNSCTTVRGKSATQERNQKGEIRTVKRALANAVFLLGRAGQRLCALPVEHVVETMRPLPTEPLA